MKQITSKDMLIQWIKEMLGAPIIRIELTDTQISNWIDMSIQKFCDHAYEGYLENTILVQLNGKKSYPMPPEVSNIIHLSKGGAANLAGLNFSASYGSNLVPDIWSSQFFSSSLTGTIVPVICQISAVQSVLDHYFGDSVNFNFNRSKSELQVLDDYIGPALLHYYYEYTGDERYDLIYNHQWVRQYALAQCKFQWGSNVGKFSQSLVGGAQINYAEIKSDAQQEIDRLNEELLTRWTDPAPIDIA